MSLMYVKSVQGMYLYLSEVVFSNTLETKKIPIPEEHEDCLSVL